ncbi:AC4 protein [Begomovirus jeskei]|uniref:AC4 protein n=1 Tax=Begomovirus jeskei TaxID=932071 RepID=E7CT39_9GEMI|nr:AC4 protein [Abutilon mosaic Bolivia virus]ADV15523.1 AC4 protein [Abutilon mosaic Bolivia virus]
MGSLIYMCCSSSKANTTAKIKDSSTWSPHIVQHSSMGTIKELGPAPTSSPTSTKTGIFLYGENSRSTGDLLEEVSKQLMTLQQRR